MREPAVTTGTSEEARRAAVRQTVQREIAVTLGISGEEIDSREPFSRYGLDSARISVLMARLSTLLERRLSPTLAWEYPTMDALVAYLTEGDRAGGGSGVGRGRAISAEPVAIVGVGCRFPGGASSPERFWELLRSGVDAIREVPEDRWSLDAHFSESPSSPGKMNTRWGGFLDQVDGFEPLFFGISPREASQMDPQQRLMLELSWEALEDAGVVPASLRESRAGVFFGVLFVDYALLADRLGSERITAHTSTGGAACIVANRVSYVLGLQGPSMTVDTACSSSLVAVHLACRSLQSGECSLALAGGVNLLLAPETTVAFSRLGAMSPDGRSKAFDARANGYVRGEGGGVVVLKRLSDALRDGDSIYCVIRGSAVNNDGPSNGLTAPNPKAQEALLRDACTSAGVDPITVHYVEAHGTGTPLGDPIEASSIGAVYGRGRPSNRPLLIGSAKTNIGHLEAAAGIAGLIKVALAIRHAAVPPSLHFETPNPLIDFDALGVEVGTALRPWPAARGELARAGVSSFGYGGTNCHVIMESVRPRPSALLLGGDSDEALAAAVRRVIARMDEGEQDFERLSRASTPGRAGPHRLAVVAGSAEELRARLEGALQGQHGKGTLRGDTGRRGGRRLVWVFSGQGSEWAGMGRGLMVEPAFRAALRRCDRVLRPHLGWSVLERLTRGDAPGSLDRIDETWPSLFAFQIALAELWQALGITPDAVLGHSIGEVAAAHVAGALSLDDAAAVLCHQARLVQRTAGEGGMALVSLAWEDAGRLIAPYGDRLTRAIAASPVSTVLSGERAALDEVVAEAAARGIFARSIGTDAAVHSPRVAVLLDELPPLLGQLRPREARLPLVSPVTGGRVHGGDLDASYWSRQLERPVRFDLGVSHLLGEGYDLFLELSPHPIVQRSIEECLAHGGAAGASVASIRRGEDEGLALREALSILYVHGVEVHPDAAGCEDSGSAASEEPALLLPLSGHSESALQSVARGMADVVRLPDGAPLADVCYTAGAHRTHFAHRAAVVARTRQEMADALGACAAQRRHAAVSVGTSPPSKPGVVFVFPGQGSQWARMGTRLLQQEAVFRQALEQCDAAMRPLAGWSLLDKLHADGASAELERVDVVQPCIFAMQIALSALWRSWGIEPDAVVGHSMGEVAASHVAGALSLEDAARVICARSRLVKRTSGQGSMAIVELPEAAALEAIAGLDGRLSVAAANGPTTTVLSGEPGAIQEVLARLSAQEVFCRPVKVDYASHCAQMDPLRGDLLEALAGLRPRASAVAIQSTAMGRRISGEEMDSAYWFQNLREPVRFHSAVATLLEEGSGIFVEISPHPVLALSLEQAVKQAKKQAQVVTSLRRDQDERLSMLGGLAALYCAGLPVDFEALHPRAGRGASLPSYPWQRQRCWLDEAPAGGRAQGRLRAAHDAPPLLGVGLTSSVDPTMRFWEASLDTERLPSLRDHVVQQSVVLPGTAYLEMALAAAREALGPGPCVLEDVSFQEALVLPSEGSCRRVQTVLSEGPSGTVRFWISALQDGAGDALAPTWAVHAAGRLSRSASEPSPRRREDLEAIRGRCRERSDGETHYAAMTARGLHYGAAFQQVQHVLRGEHESLGRVGSKGRSASGPYVVDPALLDAGFQMLVGLVTEREGSARGGPIVPVHAETLRLYERPGAELWCHVRLRPEEHQDDAHGTFEGDVVLIDDEGNLVVEVLGVRLQCLEQSASERSDEDGDVVLSLEWQRVDAPEAPAPTEKAAARGRWLLLADAGETGREVQALLEARGEAVVRVVAARGAPAGDAVDPASPEAFDALLKRAFHEGEVCRGVIHMWSLDIPSPDEITEAPAEAELLGWGSVLHLVRSLVRTRWRDMPRLWLVTRGAQAVERKPDGVAAFAASTLGLARTLTYEHPELRCTRVDLDPRGLAGEAARLVNELVLNRPEEELALRAEGRHVARIVKRRALRSVPGEIRAPAAGRSFRLEIASPGVLDRLTLRAAERRAPGPGEVEIAVDVAGLNFLDVLLALGVVPDDEDNPASTVRRLGAECAGRLVAIGEGVTGLAPGQEVIAVAEGALSSHVTTSAHLVVPRPAWLSPEEAATVPIVHLTAYHALAHVARLAKGERILIHAAAGGVGLAAIQWARHVGAEIFATAGSEAKREYLRSLGVRHVSDSRSLRFMEDVRSWTGGEGVDVVLNSLSGELLTKSLDLLRDHGRFVELGKRDYLANAALGLRPFLKNLSLSLVDLRGMWRKRPDRIRGLLQEVLAWMHQGVLSPLPRRVFSISEAQDAFRCMAQGQHTGKLVVALDDPAAQITVPADAERQGGLRPDGTYLITGGLGGLGLSVARWMIEQGARHLVLLGRQGATTSEQRGALDAMQAAGASVSVVQADVAKRPELAEVLGDIKARMPPLRGVVHAAGLLDDGLLVQQSVQRFQRVMAPKVAGAFNLHQLTEDQPLDFFVLYSSITSLLGSPGQGNYAAANAFLDALAHHRRARGLPALSIHWGPFSEVGLAAAQAVRGARLTQRGLGSLTPAEGTVRLGRLLEGEEVEVGVARLDVRQWVEFYPVASSSSLLSRLVEESARSDGRAEGAGRFRADLMAAPPDERHKLLEQFVLEQVATVLRIEVEKVARSAPLKSLGVDSLTGLELRNRLESGLDLQLSSTLIWTYPTVAALVGHAAERVGLTRADVDAPQKTAADLDEEQLRHGLKSMSDEALIAMLQEELDMADDDDEALPGG